MILVHVSCLKKEKKKKQNNSLDNSRELFKCPKDVMFCLKYAGHINEGRKEKEKKCIYICVCVCL